MHTLSDQIANYQPNQAAIDLVRSVRITFLVGISGAGKDTVKHRLLNTGHYHDIVTNTTRQPRVNHGELEKDGVQYHFTEMSEMLGMLERHELIEVNQYGTNLYGTSVAEFQKAHDEDKIAVADIDVNGVAAFEKIAPSAVRPIFLVPPTYDIWYARWQKRYGDEYVSHLDDLKLRKQTAIDELRHVVDTPYFFIVVNDDLDRTIREVDEIARTGVQTDDSRAAGSRAVHSLLADMEKI